MRTIAASISGFLAICSRVDALLDVTRVVEHVHASCRGCRYTLDGLGEPRCPECGRAYDPADPRTYESPGRRIGRHLRTARIARRIAIVSLVIACVLFTFVAGRDAQRLVPLLLVASLLGVGMTLLCLLRASLVMGRAYAVGRTLLAAALAPVLFLGAFIVPALVGRDARRAGIPDPLGRRRGRLAAVEATVLALALGCVGWSFLPGTVVIESVDGGSTLRLTNRGPGRVTFVGYSSDAPFYSFELPRDAALRATGYGFCGTGIRSHTLNPFESTEFTCDVPLQLAPGATYRVTVNVTDRWESRTVRSEPLVVQ